MEDVSARNQVMAKSNTLHTDGYCLGIKGHVGLPQGESGNY